MATTSTFTAVAIVEPVFTEPERLALAGFLAGYTGLTREAYALDLRQYASWCQQNHLRLFQARRADIECFARDLEARGRARATVTRRLCTIAGFYKYAVEEDLLEHSPAAHVRRERSDGPVFLAADSRRLDRHGSARIVRRAARRAGITKPVGPHTLRHAFITAALDAGVPLRDVQDAASHADPRTTMRSRPRQPGPARYLHRRRLPRRCRPVRTNHLAATPPGRTAAARRRPANYRVSRHFERRNRA
jgi:site-specific recombinase XerD